MVCFSGALEVSCAGSVAGARGKDGWSVRGCGWVLHHKGNLLTIQKGFGGLNAGCGQEVSVMGLRSGRGASRRRDGGARQRLCVRMRSEQDEEPEKEKFVGDKQVQDRLVKMVRLQTGKMRVSEFVDERSSYLTDIAEQAKAETYKIAADTMRGMDEAGSKVLKRVEADAQAFEDELASTRAEIEAKERECEEFEKNVQNARSEGLFFKSLYKPIKSWKKRSPEERRAIEEQAAAIAELRKMSAGSRSRRYLYGVLIFLLTLTLMETVSAGDFNFTKFSIYAGVLAFLLLQFSFEKSLASGKEDRVLTEEEKDH